ncbi:MAG: PEP-CTERM sorting domain-containing protein [Bryobacteraceae bacterium]
MVKKLGLMGALLFGATFAHGATILLTPTDSTWLITADSTGEATPPTNASVVTTLGPGWGTAVSGSNWIGPNANQGNPPRATNSFAGSTTYTTTFSLTNFQTSGVTLSLSFLVDDYLTVYLNSLSNQIYSTGACGNCYNSQTNTGSIGLNQANLNAGTNTLLFVVQTIGGPTGLSLTGSVNANPTGVPEPATYAMMIAGLGAVAAFKRYRRA